MCLALFLGSNRALPVVPLQRPDELSAERDAWKHLAQRFHTALLTDKERSVRSHFSKTYVLYAGSYEGCACGFNFQREYPPDVDDDQDEAIAAQESVSALTQYVLDSGVEEIYACWWDEYDKPTLIIRDINPAGLEARDFHFRLQELLSVKSPAD